MMLNAASREHLVSKERFAAFKTGQDGRVGGRYSI